MPTLMACQAEVYCGDDATSEGIAAKLIRDVGFDPLDAGPLRIACYTEPFALLVAQLAYEGTEVRSSRAASSGSGSSGPTAAFPADACSARRTHAAIAG